MNRDGKQLENLVRQIEELLLPQGFSVSGNNRVYNDEGVQIAEFDVEVRGRLGSTDIAWLIECRDRPGQGPAPGSWIEQLVGRRDRFGFNKVTAVSSTGFAEGAADYAKEAGIELRTVADITAQDVASWLGLTHMRQQVRHTSLKAVKLLVDSSESDERKEAVRSILRETRGDAMVLRSVKTGKVVSPAQAFHGAVAADPAVFDDLQPNGPSKLIRLHATYPEELDHFVVDTALGEVRLPAILFEGELSLRERQIPISSVTEYRRDGDGGRIAQTATFPIEIEGAHFTVEMHNLSDTGETHVLLRNE